MPIIRKMIQVGGSRAISLPKSWLEYVERKAGTRVKEIAMEINNVSVISPILPQDDETAKPADNVGAEA